ncbi:SMI1/KNR4 family protein [Streptomyces sp. NPDC021096]|uniref:SMI1/KNR4 family protein n=1 Tax=Streptomyces sp. NPDC021096 TaxID=3154792 RepID=UPI0033F0666B
MSSDYLGDVVAMLGEARGYGASPEAWADLEASLGFELPADYKKILEAYGPVQLNGHLYLDHPATARWNLGEWIRETVVAWEEVPWGDDIDGDPRPALGISEMRFGTSDGLTPVASTNRGETVFLARGAGGQEWRLFVDDGEGEFFEYSISFSEWLYRYLVGEDMAGPNSSAFYPGPVKLEGRPMSYGDETAVWYGPDRGM